MKNEECPAPASTYSYQNEKRDFTKQARKALYISLNLFQKKALTSKKTDALTRSSIPCFVLE